MKKVFVCYLIWMPGVDVLGQFNRFISSYQKFSAGRAHELVLIIKDSTPGPNSILETIHLTMAKLMIRCRYVYASEGLDLQTYFETCSTLTSDDTDESLILFLNTSSELLSDNWLKIYCNAMEDEQVGLVGATGSWQSIRESIRKDHSWKYNRKQSILTNFRKYKLLIKNKFMYRFVFGSFPNYHVRTNAFMTRSWIFNLLDRPRKINTKNKAYRLESGFRSITNQIAEMEFEVRVVTNGGRAFLPENWAYAGTFMTPNQKHTLLVADNQTRLYDKAPNWKKNEYMERTWGRVQFDELDSMNAYTRVVANA